MFQVWHHLLVDIEQARGAVTRTLAVVLEMSPSAIADTALLEADLGADSLAVVEVVFGIEERYGVRLRDDLVRRVRTVEDLARAVAEAWRAIP